MSAERGPATAVALSGAGPREPVRYRLHQAFTYAYDGPVRDLVHRLVVVPPSVHGDQRLLSGAVTVSDPAADVRWHTDGFGNRQCVLRLERVPAELELSVSFVVERGGPDVARIRRLPLLTAPSALTAADLRIASLARSLRVTDDLETADALCAEVHTRIAYGFGATDVTTPAAQALSGGVGVCQDHAHVMLALCRSVGIAARYVSGHLVGQGGTHAWVEVLAGGRVVAMDPCHGRRADSRYVTVAVGRDYRDVPPTSGTYRGSGRGTLHCERVLEPLAA